MTGSTKIPKLPDRDRGLFILAQAYYPLGDRLWCFYQCDELIENFPDSKLFFPALELQYRVADAYLNGFRKKLLGLAIVPMEDTGIEMMFRIQERAPGSPIAERCLLRTADFYYRSSQFDLAADAYGAYLRIYPRSPDVARPGFDRLIPILRNFVARATTPPPFWMPEPSSLKSKPARLILPAKKAFNNSLIALMSNWRQKSFLTPNITRWCASQRGRVRLSLVNSAVSQFADADSAT